MPAGWGLQQTIRAPGSDKTQGQGSFGPLTGGPKNNFKKKNGPYTGPVLLRQGEPGTSQCTMSMSQGPKIGTLAPKGGPIWTLLF